ncbi:GFA family protein [Roseobacter sp. HKCCA0434]|uniref:GFA family protein n=1 Tax=Roseobacter sp. HKCCA0434 TaxID=3079297 RepID=UPI002905ED84|nr:GFA family protein [Roseobacter sp. HKCCA0434]
MSLTGGCQCGAVRYAIEGEPLGFARCHCTDCQRQSGSAFGLSLYCVAEEVSWQGDLATFESVAESGNRVQRRFCSKCGVRMYHDGGGDYISIKAGTLDPGHELEPRAEIWTDSALPWVPLIEGVPRYERQPPDQMELRTAWTAWRRGQTLAFYDENAADYAAYSDATEAHPRLARWIDTLPEGARVLDLGCGTGWAAAQIGRAGFDVRAMDGSRGLAEEALQRHGIEVEIVDFAELSEKAAFEAVWAFFSLQHAPRDRMPDHLRRIWEATTPGARLFLGLKEGTGSLRDENGRLYTFYGEAEIARRLEHGGFEIVKVDRGTGRGFDGQPSDNLYVEAVRG